MTLEGGVASHDLPYIRKDVGHITEDVSATDLTARLNRLPSSWPVWKLVFLLACGGWFEVYDAFFTAYVGPGMVKSGLFVHATRGLFDFNGLGSFVAATFAGLFIGTFFCGQFSDRFGRRLVFTAALLWYTLAAIVMAFQTTAVGMDVWRLISGIGLGAELVTIDSYIAEFVPGHMRGRAFAIQQAIQYTSVPTVAFLAWLLSGTSWMGLEGWRWIMMSAAVGAAIVWLIRLKLPESPRWLVAQGRLDEAERIISDLEQQVVQSTHEPLPVLAPVAHQVKPVVQLGVLDLWRSVYRKRTIMMMVFHFFQSLGYYGFASWVPTLLAAKGITVTHSLFYSFLIAVANPLGPLIAFSFVEKVERKWMIAGAAGALAIMGIIFACQRNAALIVVVGLLMTIISNCMTFSYRAYQAELFPTQVRTAAIGIVYSISRISAMLSGFLIAFTLGHYGVGGVFTLISGSLAIVVFVIGYFGPRTKGRSLEEISE